MATAAPDLSSKLFELMEKKSDKGWSSWRSREAWAALGVAVGKAPTESEFNAAVEKLLSQNKILRREVGPEARLTIARTTVEAEPPPEEPPPAGLPTEKELMDPFGRWLASYHLPGDERQLIVENTSRAGPPAGIWSRPDFTIARLRRFQFSTERRVELQAFELKRADNGVITAVHEALAHTRFVHYAYLALHVPDQPGFEEQAAEIRAHCSSHGIGFIKFSDPGSLASFKIELDPEPKNPDQTVVDDFITRSFRPESVEKIKNWMRMP